MTSNELVPSLMFMTIAATLLIAIAAFAWFLRKRRNRALAARAFEGDEGRPPIDDRGRPLETPMREREHI